MLCVVYFENNANHNFWAQYRVYGVKLGGKQKTTVV
jgi:hypothetical protein